MNLPKDMGMFSGIGELANLWQKMLPTDLTEPNRFAGAVSKGSREAYSAELKNLYGDRSNNDKQLQKLDQMLITLDKILEKNAGLRIGMV